MKRQGEIAQGSGFQEVGPESRSLLILEIDNEEGEYQDSDQPEQAVTTEDIDDIFLCPFIDDIHELARDCVLLFFDGKSHYNGGDIPLEEVTSDDRIQMVVNTTISAASQAAYDGTVKASWIDKKPPQEGVASEDVRLLLSIFNECSSLNIPKYFAGGIALLCLEFCEGVYIPYENIESYLAEEFGEKETWYIEYEDEYGNVVENHHPDQEDLDVAEKEEEFCLQNVLIDYGMPK